MPALLTSTSMRPCSLSIAATAARTASRSVTSNIAVDAFSACAVNACAAGSTASIRRPLSTTRGAGPREALRDGETEPAIGAGHQRDFARQFEHGLLRFGSFSILDDAAFATPRLSPRSMRSDCLRTALAYRHRWAEPVPRCSRPRRGEEHDRVGDIVGGTEPSERRSGECFGANRRWRRRRARRLCCAKTRIDARTGDRAGTDRVDPDAVAPSSTASDLDSPITAHLDAAYGVRIGKPKRPAADDRLAMLAIAARLEQRNRALRAQELPGQVDRERALPIGQRDVFAGARSDRRCRRC